MRHPVLPPFFLKTMAEIRAASGVDEGLCITCQRELTGEPQVKVNQFGCADRRLSGNWPTAPAIQHEACRQRLEDEEDERQRAQWQLEARESIVEKAMATIPPRYQWASFSATDLVQRVKNKAAIERAKQAIWKRGVVLFGTAGSGKTVLACCMLRAVAEAVLAVDERAEWILRNARFMGAYDLAKSRLENPLGKGEAKLVEQAMGASLLVIDDVGLERMRSTGIEEVLHHRHAQELPTWITTFLGVNALSERYGDGIARRIYEATDDSIIIRADIGAPRAEGAQ
jgi:DNA replication protein DnaC